MKQRQLLHIVAPNNFVCHFKQLFFWQICVLVYIFANCCCESFFSFQFWKLWFQSPFLQIVLMDNFLATCRCGSSVCKLCKLSFETNFFCANFANCSEGLFPPTFCTFPFWITFLRLVVIRKRWSGSRWFNWAGGSR